jgi:hypothetical protein
MSKPDYDQREIATFPDSLRTLIVAELEAGNRIVELARTFPAPRGGAFVRLEKPVSTRPRASSPGVRFREWNSLSYAGEFTDETRRCFVLEPPHPPAIEKNMDSIREESAARERADNASRDRFY